MSRNHPTQQPPHDGSVCAFGIFVAVLTTTFAITASSSSQYHHYHHSSPHNNHHIIPKVFALHKDPSMPCASTVEKSLRHHKNACRVMFRTDLQSEWMSLCSYEILNTDDCDHSVAISRVPGLVAWFPVQRIPHIHKNNHHHHRHQQHARKTTTTKTHRGSTTTTPFHPDREPIHNITGVLEARYKLGLTGEGIHVAIIDYGVYYLHPALGGGFGPGFQVAFGYDFVGDNFNDTTESIVPDDDPLDNCSSSSHGTHVAGIVAANAPLNITTPTNDDHDDGFFIPDIPFTGVAPGVTLSAYRVFGCGDFDTAGDIVAAAILRAAQDGADVINLSLGNPGYSDNIMAVAAQVVGQAGHIVVACMGNDGNAGANVGWYPAVSLGGLGIASLNNVVIPGPALYVDGTPYYYLVGAKNGRFTFDVPYAGEFVVNNPTAVADHVLDDGCHTLRDNHPVNVKGKAVLLYCGDSIDDCNSDKCCDTVAAAGAAACIFYYSSDTLATDYNVYLLGSTSIPSLITTFSAGQAIMADLAANKTPVVIPTTKYTNIPSVTGGTLSSFSSPGLTNDLFLKPDLGGIGGKVYSTISPFAAQSRGYRVSYGTYYGTSMATPYVAGCLALLLQKRGRIGFDAARAYLQNTATITNIYNTSLVHPPAYQGAGLVNVYKAATAGTLVTPSSLSLNDTANHKGVQHIRIQNTFHASVGPVTYHLSHLPAATANTFNAGDDFVLDRATTTFTTNNVATVTFGKRGKPRDSKGERKGGKSKEIGKKKKERRVRVKGNRNKGASVKSGTSTLSVTIKPGEFAIIRLDIIPPKPASADLWPTYGGYIAITNSLDSMVTHLPYSGVAGVWNDRDIWARNSTSLYGKWALDNANGIVGLFGTTPASTGTGLYADPEFTPLTKLEVVNLANYSYVLAPVASPSRSANISITYLCKNDNALQALGLERTSIVVLFDLTAASRGQQLFVRWRGVAQRNSYKDAQRVSAPHVYGFDGYVITSDQSAIAKLPAGVYQMNFSAWKNFANTDEEVDVVTTPPFQLVYSLSPHTSADCQWN